MPGLQEGPRRLRHLAGPFPVKAMAAPRPREYGPALLGAGLLAASFLASGCATRAPFNPDDPQNVRFMGDVLYQAWRRDRRTPVVSARFPEWTEREAYGVQHRFVESRMRHDRAGGLKIGLSSEREMERYGAVQPAVGVLWENRRETPGRRIAIPRDGFMFVEPEIGFMVRRAILGPLPAAADLADYLEAAVPVVELPWVDFERGRTLVRTDLIASNLGSEGYVVGEPVSLDGLDLAALPVTVFSDGRRRVDTTGAAAYGGDPLAAARWIINEGTRRGWRLKPGDIIITGNLSPITLPAVPGIWRIDFGPLGEVEFFLRR